MALSSQEFEKLKGRLSMSAGITPELEEQGSSGVTGFLKGATKGFIGSAVDTARLLQSGGQRILAGIDPTRTYQETRDTTGLKSLNTDTAEGKYVKDTLTPKGSIEKAGAVTELAAELLIPTKVVGTVLARGGQKVASKVATKAGDIITPIEKGVETVLNPTKIIPVENLKNIPIENIVAQSEKKSSKLEKYAKQAEKAVDDYSQPTPMQIAGDTKGGEALNILNNKLAKQGQLKREALGKVGDKVVEGVPTFRTSLKDALRERVGINIDTQTGEIVNATGRTSKIALDQADNKMIKDVINLFDSLGERPTVRQLDDAVDAIQDILYKRKSSTAVPVNGQVEGLLKEFTGKLNKMVKGVAGEQYTKANDKFAYFIDIRDKLNKGLGLEGQRGAQLMKQLFSPSGEAPRRLFEDVKKLTGIDLVEEATLAKFVMENIGDARQASLLEEVIRGNVSTPRGFVGKAAEKIINKLQDPIGKAKRVIKENTRR